jgi:hypothetical protein
MSNSLGKTKTDNWSRCGEKRESETSYHGRMLRMKRKGYLVFTRLAEMLHTKITKMESRKTTKQQIGMQQTPTTKSPSGEEDLNRLWLIGPRRSCSYWNSSVRRINDEITENEGNLERGPSMTSSSEASRR